MTKAETRNLEANWVPFVAGCRSRFQEMGAEAQQYPWGVPSRSGFFSSHHAAHVVLLPFQLLSPRRKLFLQQTSRCSWLHAGHLSRVLSGLSCTVCPRVHVGRFPSETCHAQCGKDHPIHALNHRCCHPRYFYHSVDHSRLASAEDPQGQRRYRAAAQRMRPTHLF